VGWGWTIGRSGASSASSALPEVLVESCAKLLPQLHDFARVLEPL